jgi:hypothetical protein
MLPWFERFEDSRASILYLLSVGYVSASRDWCGARMLDSDQCLDTG